MKKSKIGRGLIILLLVSICVLGFRSTGKVDTLKSATSQLIDPEEMIQGGYYFFWDHGSGASVAQFDRMDNGVIHTNYSITPLQALFSRNATFTLYEAGNIQLASVLQIIHLQLCIIAGIFIP